MALDEHRSKFKTLHWQKRGTKGQIQVEKAMAALTAKRKAAHPDGNLIPRVSTGVSAKQAGLNASATSATSKNGIRETEIDAETKMRMESKSKETDVLEVWFLGCHADVGGGAVANETRHKLSQVPLRWMIRQCFECDTGILFNTTTLAEIGLDVHTLWPLYTRLSKPVVGPSPKMLEKYENGELHPISKRSTHVEVMPDEHEKKKDHHDGIKIADDDESEGRKGPVGDWTPEQVEDYFDAMADINDQLVQAKGWWVLEVWPIKLKYQREGEDEWEKKVTMNLGRYRPVLELEPNLHWTVRQRMWEKGYKPQTRDDRNAVWKVVV